jgi:hypothetical protein
MATTGRSALTRTRATRSVVRSRGSNVSFKPLAKDQTYEESTDAFVLGVVAIACGAADGQPTGEGTSASGETKANATMAEPSHSVDSKVESAGLYCTAAQCTAGCEQCGGGDGYCKASFLDGKEIQTCMCARPCI